MGKVGLAITTYNRVEYLNKFIDSLSKSDLSKLDMICVVDDCSTEVESMKPLLIKLKEICKDTIISKSETNSKIWVTLPMALEYLINSGCNTLLNLDPDCIVRKDWFNKVLDLHYKFPDDIITGFNTLTNHPIKQPFKDYFIKTSCGGINMVYNPKTYNEVIKPSFIKKAGWDTQANFNTNRTRRKIIVTNPSVIQHIGSESTMGHHGGDRALDFIED